MDQTITNEGWHRSAIVVGFWLWSAGALKCWRVPFMLSLRILDTSCKGPGLGSSRPSGQKRRRSLLHLVSWSPPIYPLHTKYRIGKCSRLVEITLWRDFACAAPGACSSCAAVKGSRALVSSFVSSIDVPVVSSSGAVLSYR